MGGMPEGGEKEVGYKGDEENGFTLLNHSIHSSHLRGFT